MSWIAGPPCLDWPDDTSGRAGRKTPEGAHPPRIPPEYPPGRRARAAFTDPNKILPNFSDLVNATLTLMIAQLMSYHGSIAPKDPVSQVPAHLLGTRAGIFFLIRQPSEEGTAEHDSTADPLAQERQAFAAASARPEPRPAASYQMLLHLMPDEFIFR